MTHKINLKDSEVDFRIIAEQSFLGIAIIQDGLIKYANQKLTDLLEYSVKEILNWAPDEFYKVIGPESVEFAKEQSPLKQLGLPGVIEHKVVQLRKKSGKLLWAENYSKTVIFQEKTANFVTIIDITKRLEMEREFKYQAGLVENVSDAIISTDFDFNIISWNKAANLIYGWEANEAIGKNISDIIPVEYLDTTDESVVKSFREEGFWKGEVIQHRKDGTLLNILTSVSMIMDDQNNPIGTVAINRDITERINAATALLQSKEKYREAFERANFYKDLFVHDINNILQVINSSTELISHRLEGFEKSEKMKLLPLIMTQIKKAKRLVYLVNLLSELEESHHPIRSLELCELLRNSIHFMYHSFPENKIDLQIHSLNKKIFVQANELLQQVFENILTNAIKYNDKATIELEIELSENHKDGKNFIQIEFRDNSMGIVDSRKTLILERGFKELKSGQGMGIGLALVKKIINSYKGDILIEDRVKGDYTQGTNFILLIPQ